MIVLESRLYSSKFIIGYPAGIGRTVEKYIDGYFLTIQDLAELVRDFQADCHDGFVSNDKAYIEEWLKKHERIEDK